MEEKKSLQSHRGSSQRTWCPNYESWVETHPPGPLPNVCHAYSCYCKIEIYYQSPHSPKFYFDAPNHKPGVIKSPTSNSKQAIDIVIELNWLLWAGHSYDWCTSKWFCEILYRLVNRLLPHILLSKAEPLVLCCTGSIVPRKTEWLLRPSVEYVINVSLTIALLKMLKASVYLR